MLRAGGRPGLEMDASCSASSGGLLAVPTMAVVLAPPPLLPDVEGVEQSSGMPAVEELANGGAPPGHSFVRMVSLLEEGGRTASN